MPRVIISEGLIEKFIVGIFNAILKEKRKSIERARAADPELKQIIQQLEQNKEELRQWLVQHQTDPKTGELTSHLFD